MFCYIYAVITQRYLFKEEKMNISANISNNIKKYRKELGLSQEGLAEKLNLTSQAVSKWECMQSIPDIESIISLCELFGITTDKLLLDKDPEVQYIEVERESAKSERENTFYFSGVPDDSKLRVLQFKGRKWIQENEYDPDVYIPIRINEGITLFNKLYVEIRGNVKFNGSRVDGNVSCGNVDSLDCSGDVSCGNVDELNCSGDVSCGNVENIRSCAGDISCGNVTRIESCSGDISCGNVDSIASVGGDISCGDVMKIEGSKGDISCGGVGQITGCEGGISCGAVETITGCSADIDCENVGSIAGCFGSIDCEKVGTMINCNFND